MAKELWHNRLIDQSVGGTGPTAKLFVNRFLNSSIKTRTGSWTRRSERRLAMRFAEGIGRAYLRKQEGVLPGLLTGVAGVAAVEVTVASA